MSSLHDKMYGFEATPPEEAWKNIAAALDEDRFTTRLHDLEVTPPAGAWKMIVDTLDGEPEKKRPARTTVIPFLRYAAAATVIGLIAFSVLKLTGINTKTNDSAAVSPSIDSGLAKGKKSMVPGEEQSNKLPTTDENKTLERDGKMLARLEHPVRARARKSSTLKQAYSDPEGSFSAPDYIYDEQAPDMAERYIQLMTPDGNFIRMSKKWSSLLCCVSGEEQDADCKDQLKKWQQKIADSPINPTAGNFLDILSLVNSLDEEL